MEWYYIILIVFLVILTVLVAVKLYVKFTTGVCNCETRLDGKIAIVTGANTGIGYETALDLARRGARVVLACRNISSGQGAVDSLVRTGNTNVCCKMLDLASLRSVRQFAAEFLASEDKLHILINNAGAGALGNVKSEDGFDLALQINHLGPFLLTNLLLPRLIESAPSRVVFVSSWVHRFAWVDLDDFNMDRTWNDVFAYCNSKLYSIMTATEMTRRFECFGITANSLHPGLVSTAAYRHVHALIRLPVLAIIKLFFKSPDEGAQTSIHLAVSPEVEGVSGKYFSDCKPARTSATACNGELAAKIWEISDRCVRQNSTETITNDSLTISAYNSESKIGIK